MHNYFLIPLDQSKKEYIKFYNLYFNTKLCDKFYFLPDFNLGSFSSDASENIFFLENKNFSKLELTQKSDEIIKSFGFNNIDDFAILEYEQNMVFFILNHLTGYI